MPTTTKGLRYPIGTDRVADGATAIGNLAADVNRELTTLASVRDVRHLAFDTQTEDVQTGSTGWEVICPDYAGPPLSVTIPDLGPRRLLITSSIQCQVGQVGRVEAAHFRGGTNLSPWGNSRLTNPTDDASYLYLLQTVVTAPAAGTYDFTLRMRNVSAAPAYVVYRSDLAVYIM